MEPSALLIERRPALPVAAPARLSRPVRQGLSRGPCATGEAVEVLPGPLSDFSGEISAINDDAARLKVLVSIFGRETPVEVGYDQVKKL